MSSVLENQITRHSNEGSHRDSEHNLEVYAIPSCQSCANGGCYGAKDYCGVPASLVQVPVLRVCCVVLLCCVVL